VTITPKTTKVQAVSQLKGDYGEDELKSIDRALSGQKDHDEPLDPAKLTAEIAPAVKDIKPEIKANIKNEPKTSSAVQTTH
jgi:hypothetical protein